MRTLKGKINLIFSIVCVLLILLYLAILEYQKQSRLQEFVKQERQNSHYLYLYFLQYGKIDEGYLESQNIRLVKGKEQKGIIGLFAKDKEGKTHYKVLDYQYKRFILIDNDHFNILLENMNKPKFLLETTLLFAGVAILLLLLYYWIVKSLQPLLKLKEQIKTFSEGNLDIDCKSTKKDEIADVANEFDHAVKMIRELLSSRQLFLRAIMHELKTPIAKGRLVSEMVGDEKQKNRLHSIFVRLNLLIDEFVKIEQITSKNFHLNIKPYRVSRLLEEGIGLLLNENTKQSLTINTKIDAIILVDKELFALVLKNIIDNALNYSPNHKAEITLGARYITISNKGKPIAHDIRTYFVPFHQSEKSLGLGLYIVKSILDILQMELEYRYDNDSNFFTIFYNAQDIIHQ